MCVYIYIHTHTCVCVCLTVLCFICIHLLGCPSLLNWRSENVLFYTHFNEPFADGCLQKKYKAGILKWSGRRGMFVPTETVSMYIQNPKSLQPLNSVFTLIPVASKLHYIKIIICIWCGVNITNIYTITLDLVLISKAYLTLFCLEVPYAKRMTII
jgi:hypothetical protein